MEKKWQYITPTQSGGAVITEQDVTAEMVLLWIAGGAASIYEIADYGIAGSVAALPFWALSMYIDKRRLRLAKIELLQYYAQIKEPIFEWQQSATDTEVVNRAQRHRELLKESGNSLFENDKIGVIEIYYKDPAFDYCETFDEYLTRRYDVRRDYLRNWAKKVSDNDEDWRKAILHSQVGIYNSSEVRKKWL